MDRYGELDLSWSVGYGGSPLHYVVDDVLMYECGNTLAFVQADGSHIRSLQSDGSGITALTVCHKTSYIAYAECTFKPKIFVIVYPMCYHRSVVEDGAQLEYKKLAFSSDGKKLLSLSGVPDFKMTLWDITEPSAVEICSVVVGEGLSDISVNPLNWKQMLLLGPTKLTLWTLEHCGKEDLLTPVDITLPEKDAEVGSSTTPKIPPPASTFIPVPDMDLQPTANMGLFVPPNMSEVFYKDSYEDFVREKQPMEPVSHCWTPKQSIYVGCVGGQLVAVDFDTGTATVMVNQQPAIQGSDTESGESLLSSETSETPKTAHSLLKEGSTDCLLLSRRGLFTAGRSGLVQCFDTITLGLVDEVTISHPIRQVCCSPSCTKLAVGTEGGAIFTAQPLQLASSLELISDHLSAELIGLDVLCPGSEHFVTCRSDGNLQVWEVEKGGLLSTLNLETECTSVACPLSCKVAVIGAASGHLYMVSLVDPASPTLVEKRLMHSGPVTAVKHDQCGHLMASISPGDPVFLYNSKPSTKFEVFGYLDMTGNVIDVSLIDMNDCTGVGILHLISKGQQEVTYSVLNHSLLQQKPPELYSDASKKLSQEFLECRSAILEKHIKTLTLAPEHTAFSTLESTMQLAQFDLPQPDQQVFTIKPNVYEAHDMDCGKIILSLHQRWLASVASEGKLLLRLTGNPETFLSGTPHHYKTGGCRDVIFTGNTQSLITIGDSRSITCWRMKCSDYGELKSEAAAQYFARFVELMKREHDTENKILEEMPALDLSTTDVPKDAEKTWFILAKEEATKAEDEKYSETKANLQIDLSTLREKVLEMIATNENLPDIEKLGRQEFILDTEDYQRMLQEEEKLIAAVREEIEFANLAAMFLRYRIKRDCWDNMVVKGRTIKGFQAHTEVHNYPLLARSEAAVKELEKIKVLRSIEIVERKLRKAATTEKMKTIQPSKPPDVTEDEDFLGEGGDKLAQPKEEEDEKDKSDPSALLGSHRDLYGDQNNLLASQFELHSQVSKKHQMVLLEDSIFTIKENFNKEFDEVLRLKASEIARVKEKNVRIAKIIAQLKLDDALVQPSLSVLEEPERLLVVEDSEVTVEKYVSPEEQQQLEEEARQEEERKRAAMGDNPRERALDMMMGGRLEANVEEDLFKDLSRPDFMAKDPAEMSEEEIRMAREFEKREEAFLEEREKLKKALEAELRKLQGSITQGMEQFDERLQKLFQKKIQTQMVIHQEELKILHLARSLFLEEELGMKMQQINDLLREKKVTKVHLGASISEAKIRVEEVREQYEALVSEDKEMDKSFKRDFADCEPYVDQLYRLFRKRPRGQKHKAALELMVADPNSQNLFALRPSSASTQLMKDGDHIMSELDHQTHMPDGLDSAAWERFVAHRHRKVESEMKVKTLALELAEVNSFLQRRQNEESRVQHEIQNAFKEISKLQEDKVVFDLNLEIQFLLKQGQVEVDMDDFIPDFSNSVLVHRSRIEDLNSQIKTLGKAKLNSMTECKDFKKGIRMLEWERHKMALDEEELLDKALDIQMMRVTRDLLQRLHEKDLFAKDIREKETIESTIEFNKRAQKKLMLDKMKTLKDVSKQVKSKMAENKEIDKNLREIQVAVAERAQIEKLADVAPSEANREQRMIEIKTRKELVNTVKSQDETYSSLRAEVERLRMKTFPALVQVD